MAKPKLDLTEVKAITSYCSEEVWRQGRGPHWVGRMVEAWMSAIEMHQSQRVLTHAMLQHWAALIEPAANVPGRYRGVNVRVGTYKAPPVNEVRPLMDRWLNFLSEMSAGEAYREFQHVHPFTDGNGRTGKIVYNWLSGSLRAPQFPPDYFGGIRNP